MAELAEVRDLAKPHETLLVADALTGQDAVNTARIFHERIGITGIVLTRMDGDARGGAALCMRHVTGQPIKLVGMGEKLDALEAFHPERVASRILDMGDVVSLVEQAAETGRQGRGREAGQEDGQGQLRPRRPALAAAADAQDGRHEGHSRQAAGRAEDAKAARARPTSTRR